MTTTTLRRINTSPVITTSTTTSEATRPIIPIVRSVYNAPSGNDGAWDYSFEAGNGIKQQAQGSLRSLGDTQVEIAFHEIDTLQAMSPFRLHVFKRNEQYQLRYVQT